MADVMYNFTGRDKSQFYNEIIKSPYKTFRVMTVLTKTCLCKMFKVHLHILFRLEVIKKVRSYKRQNYRPDYKIMQTTVCYHHHHLLCWFAAFNNEIKSPSYRTLRRYFVDSKPF